MAVKANKKKGLRIIESLFKIKITKEQTANELKKIFVFKLDFKS